MSNPDTVAKLVTTRPDAELAAEFKQRMAEGYETVLRLLDEINAAGFQCQVTSTLGPLGKNVITVLQITKVF